MRCAPWVRTLIVAKFLLLRAKTFYYAQKRVHRTYLCTATPNTLTRAIWYTLLLRPTLFVGIRCNNSSTELLSATTPESNRAGEHYYCWFLSLVFSTAGNRVENSTTHLQRGEFLERIFYFIFVFSFFFVDFQCDLRLSYITPKRQERWEHTVCA